MLPRLSIVIPSHNRPDLLEPCLDSVLRHAPSATEILVIDDASPAASASRIAARFPGVRSLRLPTAAGFCAAVNQGIHAARAPVVELLNDDTEVTAGWADAALAHFDDSTVAAVAPLVLYGRPGQGAPCVDSAGDRYFVGGIAGKRGHRQPLTAELLQARSVFGASASSAFYRRSALLAADGFPEDFGAYFEDVDLSFRLHWAGHRIVFEPASWVWHQVSSSYGRPSRRLLAMQARNEERVFWRNLPSRVLLRALPGHLAVLAAKAFRRWRAGELLPFLMGRLAVLAEIPDLLRHRRRLRACCSCPDVWGWGVERHFWGTLIQR